MFGEIGPRIALLLNWFSRISGDVTIATPTLASTVAKIQGTTISGTTGSGNVVFSTSPTLVTPALGTPSALVGTNITGTAASLTAGTVTTNANLTGDVTSVGNTTTAVNVGGVPIVGTTTTQTLTNKRVTKRTGTTTSSATPTINTDNVDFYSLTAQTADITSFTTNLSGTPTEAQTLWIAITGTAARAITWGTSFEASTVALPTTTVTTARLDVGFIWNTVTSKWRCIATA